MVQSDKWTERFRISAKDLSQAKTLELTGDPLRWCLMNGKIPEIEYLEWAMGHFELPSINSDFFTAPPDHFFWNRVKDMHPWHEGFFPVSEWEGTLLIACLSPLEGLKLNQPHQFVLASARHLLLLWNHLNPEAAAGPSKPIEFTADLAPAATSVVSSSSLRSEDSSVGVEMPEGFFSNPNTLNVMNEQTSKGELDFGAMFAASSVPKAGDEKDEFNRSENSVVAEMPEGFSSAGFESSVVDVSQPAIDAPIDATIVAKPFKFEIPETITFEKPQKKVEAPTERERAKEIAELTKSEPQVVAKPPVKASVQAKAAPAQVVTPPKAAPAAVATTPVVASPKAPVEKPMADMETTTATITDLQDSSSKVEDVSSGTATEADQVAPEPTAEDTANGEPSGEQSTDTRFALSNVSLRPLDATVSQDDLGAVSLGHILSNFNGAMVLIMEDGILKPWKWSDLLTTSKSSQMTSILLDQPSIFKIVHRTKLPYHGHVRPSEITTAFFDSFQNGRLPPHITIVPVVVRGEVYAMLLGLLVKGEGSRSMLSQMETLADDFARKLTETKRESAA